MIAGPAYYAFSFIAHIFFIPLFLVGMLLGAAWVSFMQGFRLMAFGVKDESRKV